MEAPILSAAVHHACCQFSHLAIKKINKLILKPITIPPPTKKTQQQQQQKTYNSFES